LHIVHILKYCKKNLKYPQLHPHIASQHMKRSLTPKASGNRSGLKMALHWYVYGLQVLHMISA